MNPLYDQFFNPQYANVDYLRQCQRQHEAEQQREILNAVKAIHDYFDAARKNHTGIRAGCIYFLHCSSSGRISEALKS